MTHYDCTATVVPRAGYLGPSHASTFGSRRDADPYIAALHTHQDCPDLAVEGPLSDALVWKLCVELDCERFEGGFGVDELELALHDWLGMALDVPYGRDRCSQSDAMLDEWLYPACVWCGRTAGGLCAFWNTGVECRLTAETDAGWGDAAARLLGVP